MKRGAMLQIHRKVKEVHIWSPYILEQCSSPIQFCFLLPVDHPPYKRETGWQNTEWQHVSQGEDRGGKAVPACEGEQMRECVEEDRPALTCVTRVRRSSVRCQILRNTSVCIVRMQTAGSKEVHLFVTNTPYAMVRNRNVKPASTTSVILGFFRGLGGAGG